MKNGEFRLRIVLLSLLIVLGLLLTGFTIYTKKGIEEPLINDISALEGIQEVSINKNKVYIIEVQINQVASIENVYQSILKSITSKLADNEYELLLVDQPNAKLNELSAKLKPAIYQALANNEFLWLDKKLNDISAGEEVVSHMFIDEKYLYIQLSDGDSYIYRIFNRAYDTKATI